MMMMMMMMMARMGMGLLFIDTVTATLLILSNKQKKKQGIPSIQGGKGEAKIDEYVYIYPLHLDLDIIYNPQILYSRKSADHRPSFPLHII